MKFISLKGRHHFMTYIYRTRTHLSSAFAGSMGQMSAYFLIITKKNKWKIVCFGTLKLELPSYQCQL